MAPHDHSDTRGDDYNCFHGKWYELLVSALKSRVNILLHIPQFQKIELSKTFCFLQFLMLITEILLED